MNQDEVESQLSAMFDGELPSAECELLSRRIDRDENLRSRWSRYALIGAAMRLEPVATARSDFAARVSSAVDRAQERIGVARQSEARAARRRGLVWQGALAATLVLAVAGLSITLLRELAVNSTDAVALLSEQAGVGARLAHGALASLPRSASDLLARQREALAVLGIGEPGPRSAPTQTSPKSPREPWSYVTPPDTSAGNTALRTELVDYIVAHSAYSTPLMRPDLLSALVSGEEGGDGAQPASSAAGFTGVTNSAAAAAGAAAPDAAAIGPAAGVGDNATTAANPDSR